MSDPNKVRKWLVGSDVPGPIPNSLMMIVELLLNNVQTVFFIIDPPLRYH
jgi:hypothetical protein